MSNKLTRPQTAGELKARSWLASIGAKIAFAPPDLPLESWYCESYRPKPIDERLDSVMSSTLRVAQIRIAKWAP